ncbi:sensor domain-containing diguanylate cyclase [Sulfurirhabdus autotrophica]|uniref:diguanylate cyclase n=1 Tax=Sulfurirhabdus autotrophica TaxID=1706046 RepID=A0A4R3YIY9_9PROT|nr:diguanylate cyclase [Sulfurirhabdus autotrophica]TCV90653.1 diguanylate cyclase (GGDEF)-like protein [Sulfurirhabdus autotrophica]
MRFRSLFPYFWLLTLVWHSLVAAAPISVALESDAAIGLYTSFLKDQTSQLKLTDAEAIYKSGKFLQSQSPFLNFGIGSKPVWIHFSVDNPTGVPVTKRLSIETAWLDSIDIYVKHQGINVAEYHLGDSKPFALRPLNSRFFTLDQRFNTGVSDVFLRIETPDPMVVPIYLMNPKMAQHQEIEQGYSYGIIYGFLFALIAYNMTLFIGLRSSRFFFYSLYLTMFMAMNIAYTSHGYQWIWPLSVKWQLWAPPVLMYFYSLSGLLFAIRFLDTKDNSPRIYNAVLWYSAVFGVWLAAAIMMDSQLYALLSAFTFMSLFTIIMLFLGGVSVYSGHKPARYFLLAAIAAMVGAVLTTLSTWGFIPLNNWTFRAVEIGMLIDATLLALALAYQFRVGQEEKIRAEQLAQLDPLTGLNNRRAFYDKTAPLWSMTLRNGRSPSVILLDIDLFKEINDNYGHPHGDKVLVVISNLLKKLIRQADVLARWGGEEFIIYLPETSPQEATTLAERLRSEISNIRVPHSTGETAVTASFGVAPRNTQHATLDSLIATADDFLYHSKQQGRNRVTCSSVSQ